MVCDWGDRGDLEGVVLCDALDLLEAGVVGLVVDVGHRGDCELGDGGLRCVMCWWG